MKGLTLVSPLAALGYYLGGGFALALFCAMWFFDRPADLDEVWRRRLRRRAHILMPLGLQHPVIALTAFGIARDVARDADPDASRLTMTAATVGLVISLAIAAVVVAITG